ncbi:tyrosine-type recombinase/integrase [Deefgea tanakiae]|uniref:Tyrosine-type recombinase/integrase n=1 Tax=Deefgea tanakiae TaxID=2865840 RepID=A0ABX8Z7W9_9NEIS|nr:tyrosine-type recombinase/integrase [Deefgea tanakiae]QZA78658.1 tyrosine-type recombinase/integrase [Deefgea tanakiae]
MAIITDTKARSIKPTDKTLAHGGVSGLSLVASKNKGIGYWELRFTSPTTGKRRVIGFGTYPDVSILEAGKLAQSARELLTQGIDPLDHRQEAEKIKSAMPSFEQAARALHTDLSPSWRNPKHANDWINSLIMYAFTDLGSTPVGDVTPKHIADVLRPIWIEKAETASRVKQRMSAVMSWAWAHGYCSANPVDVVNHLLPKQEGKASRTEHFPAMPWRLIPEFVTSKIMAAQRYDSTRPLLEFLILVACRSGEARGMTWDEVDLVAGIWTIPAARMKMKQIHRVPLSDRALTIIEGQKGRHASLVFPAPRGGELSDMALTSFLRRHEAVSGTANRVATAHGFRSSFRDWASENEYPRDLAERALAHSVANKTEAAYHRTDLLEQRRPMMQAWSDHVTGKQISQMNSGNNVHVLKRA